MNLRIDSVLMIGFGGPTRGCCRKFEDCPGEAFCFVQNVVGERTGDRERIREVAAHYDHFGGVSPFSFFSQKQAGALEMSLEQVGKRVPVFVGCRFWTPYVKEALVEMRRQGLRRALGIVLAPHRSKVSWEAYKGVVQSACQEIGEDALQVEFIETPWFDRPGYVEATVGRIKEIEQEMNEERFRNAHLIFSAHSIPVSMAKVSPYEVQFAETARLVSNSLGREEFDFGYQSSPNVPPGTWLEPDVLDVIEKAAEKGAKDVILVPVGFICDHVEVLFDLDVEAKEKAEECGMGFYRAGTVGIHPDFVAMLRDLISEQMAGEKT